MSLYCTLVRVVLRGLNMFDRTSTRGSGTSTIAVWISSVPEEYAAVSICPRVSALKMVVLVLLGSPMMPICTAGSIAQGGEKEKPSHSLSQNLLQSLRALRLNRHQPDFILGRLGIVINVLDLQMPVFPHRVRRAWQAVTRLTE